VCCLVNRTYMWYVLLQAARFASSSFVRRGLSYHTGWPRPGDLQAEPEAAQKAILSRLLPLDAGMDARLVPPTMWATQRTHVPGRWYGATRQLAPHNQCRLAFML
jgi:hypothetical protein